MRNSFRFLHSLAQDPGKVGGGRDSGDWPETGPEGAKNAKYKTNANTHKTHTVFNILLQLTNIIIKKKSDVLLEVFFFVLHFVLPGLENVGVIAFFFYIFGILFTLWPRLRPIPRVTPTTSPSFLFACWSVTRG